MASLGIDIGCISLKAALVGDPDDRDLFSRLLAERPDLFQSSRDGLTLVEGRPLLVTRYRRIKGSPAEATKRLLEELRHVVPAELLRGVRVTGSGARLIAEALGAPFENEFKAIARGLSSLHPEAQTIFEMGGETSKFIRLDASHAGAPGGISDYQTNGDCAAGTGSFMDQQASRLLYEIEDVGDIVLGAGKAASIAGRCSVFAKSDMIHAQQKGYEPPEVLRGLCDAVVRNFRGTIAKGKVVAPPVAFIGGVAANKGAVQALREAFGLEDGGLFVPEFHFSMGAIGAALLEAAAGEEGPLVAGLEPAALPAAEFPVAEPLSMEKVLLLRDTVKPYEWPADGRPVDVFMGIDIGSVSTNFVVMDEAGEVIKEIYTTTDARPVEVVNAGLAEIRDEIGDRIVLRGVGTTGSGRELIGELTGADT
ncbi:MAG TPA: BadF/BadG/BcrA/BcrD ATPase family protein, partial [Thermoleophilia bacterium]|nr:BadF/BadG/BcrA/BcrD ATPase family protein [Thermoleophilia bacterium]